MRIQNCVVYVLLSITVSMASLRVRRTDCSHMSLADCHTVESELKFADKMLPGIWNDYDPQTGFDEVSGDNMGSYDEDVVIETWWIDSLYEPEHDRSAPFLYGNVEHPVRRAILYIAGGIYIEEPGTYEFYVGHPDWMWSLFWIDQNGNGEIDLDNNDDAVNGVYSGGSWNSRGGSYAAEITFDEPGLYRVLYNSYHRFSNKGYLTVEWKKPGGEREPIPSSAFGVRRQFGLPRAIISKIIYNGDTLARPFQVLDSVFQLPMLAHIEIDQCQPVVLFAEAENMLGEDPVFYWNFGNSKMTEMWEQPERSFAECSQNSVTYNYPCASCAFSYPSVRVKRGGTMSYQSRFNPKIHINDDSCSVFCEGQTACGAVLSIGSQIPRQGFERGNNKPFISPGKESRIILYDLRGRMIRTFPYDLQAVERLKANTGSGIYLISIPGDTREIRRVPGGVLRR